MNNPDQNHKSIAQLEENISNSNHNMKEKNILKEYSISTKDFDYSINEKDVKIHLKRIPSFQDVLLNNIIYSYLMGEYYQVMELKYITWE